MTVLLISLSVLFLALAAVGLLAPNLHARSIRKHQLFDFGDAKYWDARYKMSGPDWDSKDWLFAFDDVRLLMEELIPRKDGPLLMLGCGNSEMSKEMYDSGYSSIINIDISPAVIEKMAAAHPEMNWLVGDVLDMTEILSSSVFSCVDKSTLDAIRCMPVTSPPARSPVSSSFDTAMISPVGNIQAVHRMISEIHRVLVPGGRYVCLSLTDVDDLVKIISSNEEMKQGQAVASFYRVRNMARDATYSLVVLDKIASGRESPRHPLTLRNVLPGRCFAVIDGHVRGFVLKKM